MYIFSEPQNKKRYAAAELLQTIKEKTPQIKSFEFKSSELKFATD